MIRTAQMAVVIVVLAASLATATSQVTNVQLGHKVGKTVATIETTGEVRFSHQTEIAKDGKPFRVIVDILSATHELQSKNFTLVPSCIISGIRTSQYSVDPEKVVRLVFDMQEETVYQIASQGDLVWITFPDKKAPAFATWNSREAVAKMLASKEKGRGFVAPELKHETVVAHKSEPTTQTPKTAKHYNDAYDKDRLVSLQGESAQPKKQVRVPAPKAQSVATVPPVEKAAKVKSTPVRRAEFSDKDKWANLYQKSPESKPVVKESVKKTTVAAKPVVKEPVKKTTVAAKPVVKEPKAGKVVNKTAVPYKPLVLAQSDPVTDVKASPAKKNKKTPAEKVQSKVNKEKPADEAVKQPEVSKPIPKKVDRKATSRFRRNPVMSKKMKGTLVAEFPKRLVVKYKSQGRDPFATLINEAAVSHNQMEQRIPNVDGLRMVGVIEAKNSQNSALFEDGDGYGYILKAGDKVRRGYVLRVENDRVYFQIFEYGWSRTVALNLEG